MHISIVKLLIIFHTWLDLEGGDGEYLVHGPVKDEHFCAKGVNLAHLCKVRLPSRLSHCVWRRSLDGTY